MAEPKELRKWAIDMVAAATGLSVARIGAGSPMMQEIELALASPPKPDGGLADAVKAYFDAKWELHDFEAEHPNNCGNAWEEKFEAKGLRETEMAAALEILDYSVDQREFPSR